MNPFTDAQASLIRFVKDTLQQSPFYEPQGQAPMAVVDFDGIDDESMLPEQDIFGFDDYSIINEGGNYSISGRIALSTKQDENLVRLRNMTNLLFNACAPDRLVKVLDGETGRPIGQMKFMSGTHALPLVVTRIRSYRYIAVTLLWAAPATP